MPGYKWDGAKSAAVVLPFLLLLAYLGDLALPLPGLLLPERRYIALAAPAGLEELRAARGRAAEAFLISPTGLLPLPPEGSPESAWTRALAALPASPSTDAVKADLGEGFPAFATARLVASPPPSPKALEELSAAAREAGVPLALELSNRGSPLLALSYRANALERRVGFELALDRSARESPSVELRLAAAGGSAETLWAGPGSRLPADGILRLAADREALAGGTLSLRIGDFTADFRLLEGGKAEPELLVICRPGAPPSFLDSLYATRRVGAAEAEGLPLDPYELVVLEGLPLEDLPARLQDSLALMVEERRGSLLLVADSPETGRKGAAPRLERLLPVTLLPRDLKDLPDLAVLLLIDVSGSMFGDKLSLAKVTGLELLRNLKPSDRVGMLLFSDERAWVYDFPVNSSIAAAPVLEPVSAGGGTDLGAALAEGLEALSRQPLGERHVIVISDGVTKPADFAALAARAKELRASLSTMGVGADLDRPLLERLAERGGGRFYRVEDAAQIPALVFEDRKSAARAPFRQGRIPVLDLGGTRVAEIGGMALYAPAQPATVLFANEFGDPLLASREYGNRATLVFASDLNGTYTASFLASRRSSSVLKARLDALFTERPLEYAATELAGRLTFHLKSSALASPRLRVVDPAGGERELPLLPAGREGWAAELHPGTTGLFHASLVDRGSTLASFELVYNGVASGLESPQAERLGRSGGAAFRIVRPGKAWLLLFFLASLGASVVLRYKR